MFNMSNASGNTNRMKISSSFPIMNTVKIFKNTLRVYFDCHFFKKRLKKTKNKCGGYKTANDTETTTHTDYAPKFI